MARAQGPVENSMSSFETACWLLFLYYWFGNLFYTEAPDLQLNAPLGGNKGEAGDMTVVDVIYFLTATMTTIG